MLEPIKKFQSSSLLAKQLIIGVFVYWFFIEPFITTSQQAELLRAYSYMSGVGTVLFGTYFYQSDKPITEHLGSTPINFGNISLAIALMLPLQKAFSL